MLRRFSAHARFHATTLSPSSPLSPMPIPLSCPLLFLLLRLPLLSLSVEVILIRIAQLCATFPLTLRRYDNCWQRLRVAFTASLTVGPRSSWHCIPHLRAGFLKRTVDLNVGRAKLGTFTGAHTCAPSGRSYARRRGYSWCAAADDPTSRGHDGADGGRVDEHWLANVVEVMMSVESAWDVHCCASLRGFSDQHVFGGNVNDPFTQPFYPSRSGCGRVQTGGERSDTMARMVMTTPSILSTTPANFLPRLKGSKPAGARAIDDARFDGAAGSPSVEIASPSRSHPPLFASETGRLKKTRKLAAIGLDSTIRPAPAFIPAVSLERLHYTKTRARSDQIVFGAQHTKIATTGSRWILGALEYDGKCSACFGEDDGMVYLLSQSLLSRSRCLTFTSSFPPFLSRRAISLSEQGRGLYKNALVSSNDRLFFCSAASSTAAFDDDLHHLILLFGSAERSSTGSYDVHLKSAFFASLPPALQSNNPDVLFHWSLLPPPHYLPPTVPHPLNAAAPFSRKPIPPNTAQDTATSDFQATSIVLALNIQETPKYLDGWSTNRIPYSHALPSSLTTRIRFAFVQEPVGIIGAARFGHHCITPVSEMFNKSWTKRLKAPCRKRCAAKSHLIHMAIQAAKAPHTSFLPWDSNPDLYRQDLPAFVRQGRAPDSG
ncbi:hypothetical protein B0H16DRAFT_1785844 [Mycena metata]|uniref:Uncharacterized protein n=1 Tax=Mycena metata TaxID=1033252 RepID=A0AAD7HNB1_9AGAR|nr:hypothetical protein B0H16DRAFT_1785844 [Mycena metata]